MAISGERDAGVAPLLLGVQPLPGRCEVTRVALSNGNMTLTSARSLRDTRTAAFENVEDIPYSISPGPAAMPELAGWAQSSLLGLLSSQIEGGQWKGVVLLLSVLYTFCS